METWVKFCSPHKNIEWLHTARVSMHCVWMYSEKFALKKCVNNVFLNQLQDNRASGFLQNTVTSFRCEAPEMLCGQRNSIRHREK